MSLYLLKKNTNLVFFTPNIITRDIFWSKTKTTEILTRVQEPVVRF